MKLFPPSLKRFLTVGLFLSSFGTLLPLRGVEIKVQTTRQIVPQGRKDRYAGRPRRAEHGQMWLVLSSVEVNAFHPELAKSVIVRDSEGYPVGIQYIGIPSQQIIRLQPPPFDQTLFYSKATFPGGSIPNAFVYPVPLGSKYVTIQMEDGLGFERYEIEQPVVRRPVPTPQVPTTTDRKPPTPTPTPVPNTLDVEWVASSHLLNVPFGTTLNDWMVFSAKNHDNVIAFDPVNQSFNDIARYRPESSVVRIVGNYVALYDLESRELSVIDPSTAKIIHRFFLRYDGEVYGMISNRNTQDSVLMMVERLEEKTDSKYSLLPVDLTTGTTGKPIPIQGVVGAQKGKVCTVTVIT